MTELFFNARPDLSGVFSSVVRFAFTYTKATDASITAIFIIILVVIGSLKTILPTVAAVIIPKELVIIFTVEIFANLYIRALAIR